MSRGLETIWGISLTPPPPRRFSPRKKCESHRSLHVSLHIPHSQLTRCIMRYNADSCISQIESMYLAWHPPIYPFPKWGLWYEFFFFFVKKKNITCVPSWIQLIFKLLCVRSSKQKNTVAWKRLRFRKSHLDLHGYIGLTSPINTVSLSFKMSF